MATADTDRLSPLRTFVQDFTGLLDAGLPSRDILERGSTLLRALIRTDDWLPERLTAPHPDHFVQNLLHCDVHERFSVVAFVWGPGQATPPHNHLTWGMIGVLRGGERVRQVARAPDGTLVFGVPRQLHPGDIDLVSDASDDAHVVENANADRVSVSIHVYGGNIGRIERQIWRDDGTQPFVSGYSNDSVPNLWAAAQ